MVEKIIKALKKAGCRKALDVTSDDESVVIYNCVNSTVVLVTKWPKRRVIFIDGPIRQRWYYDADSTDTEEKIAETLSVAVTERMRVLNTN